MKYNKQDIVLNISFYNEIKEDYFIFKIWRTIYETHDKYDTRHDEPPSDVPIEMEDIYWNDVEGNPVTDKQDVFIQALLKTIPDLIDAKFLAAYNHFLLYKKQDTTEIVINGYETAMLSDSEGREVVWDEDGYIYVDTGMKIENEGFIPDKILTTEAISSPDKGGE